VGIFGEKHENGIIKVSILVVHKEIESVAALPKRLAGDKDYLNSAKEYLAATSDDPIYQRIESSLLAAISGMPKLELPDISAPRIFNLRVYESHNERAAAKKIEMLKNGELAIFRQAEITPVFLASALIGSAIPNLTYMLVFRDEDGHDKAWENLGKNPEWVKLKAIPEYADKNIVSKITNRLLWPVDYADF
jgi:hypothetical protein